MEVFISYRGTARAAEAELMRLVRQTGRALGFRSPLVAENADGWSRMLPGLVCDLEPGIGVDKVPAIFVGLLNEQLLISCKLEEAEIQMKDQNMLRSLREQDINNYVQPKRSGEGVVRRNLLAQIPDESIFVTRIAGDPVLTNQYLSWGGAVGIPMQSTQDATVAAILQLANEASGSPPSERYLSNLVALLFDGASGGVNNAACRRLAREYNCRFAWSSVRLRPSGQSEFPLIEGDPISAEQLREKGTASTPLQVLSSFWEKSGSLLWPSSLLYSPFVDNGPARAWPPWLRFLIFVTNAGLQANSKLWTSHFRGMLRGHKRAGRKRRSPSRKKEGADSGDSGSLDTLMDLFRGSNLPLGHRPKRRAIRGRERKALLLKIERALYIPNTNTILSLYRGDVCPVRAPAPKVRRKK